MSHLQAVETKTLRLPANTTAGGSTGAYVDLQGLINPGVQNLKAILIVTAGTTAGTAGGAIKAANDTAGAGLTTVLTFTGVTSAGGVEEGHFYTEKRYVRFDGTVQSGKNMTIGALVQGEARYRP